MQEVNLAEFLKRSSPTTWLFTGDSITQGAVHTRGWRDFSQLFKERLGELARNDDIVINTGVGGWSLGPLAQRLEDRVLRWRPDVVFPMFGTNDSAAGAEHVKSWIEAYVDVIAKIRAAGVSQVVVQTTIPMMPTDPEAMMNLSGLKGDLRQGKLRGFQMRRQHLGAYVQATREVAQGASAPLIDHWSVWESAGAARGELMDGGFHPNEYGHRLIAHAMFRACGMWDPKSWTCRLFVPTYQ